MATLATNMKKEEAVQQPQTVQSQQQAQKPAADTQKVTSPQTTASTAQTQTPAAASTPKKADYSTVTPVYDGRYDQQLQDLYDQIVNRKPFEYNSEDDELYQQYKERYIQGGQKAMEDTMGQLAGLTGGYGNSYAQRVGQQTYDEHLTGLNDRASELYQQAYLRYQDQGDRLQQQYGMLGDMAQDDYTKYVDQYNRYMSEAALRGTSGDFEAYRQMWGDDAANRMQQLYYAQTLMPLYQNGQIDAEEYKKLTGKYPVGYVPPGSGGDDEGGMDPYTYGQIMLSYHL